MFNNCDPNTNGESSFYNFFIKNKASIIFDVGSRNDTLLILLKEKYIILNQMLQLSTN